MERSPTHEVEAMPPFNPDLLSPTIRSKYIVIGRKFGSDRTYAQGVETYNGAMTHAAALKAYGFSPAKANRLGEATDALKALGGDRELARLAAGQGTDARHAAQAAGKAARRKASSVMELALDELRLAGFETVAADAERVLRQTTSSGSDLSLLDRQLETLTGAFTSPEMSELTDDAGGPEALEALTNARQMLAPVLGRGRTHAGNTPIETERLDILDGIIVELCRQARAASRKAAIALAQPAMAKAFELDVLYGRKKSSTEAPQKKAVG